MSMYICWYISPALVSQKSPETTRVVIGRRSPPIQYIFSSTLCTWCGVSRQKQQWVDAQMCIVLQVLFLTSVYIRVYEV